jgi:hypothetical protein
VAVADMGEAVAEVLLPLAQGPPEQAREAQARHLRATADLAAAAVEGTATAILVLTTKQIQIQIYKRMTQLLRLVIGNEPLSTAIRPLKTTSGQALLLGIEEELIPATGIQRVGTRPTHPNV